MKKIIKQGLDQPNKLNDSGRMIVDISNRQLQILVNKMAVEQLDDKDLKILEALTRIVQSQQTHMIKVVKLQHELELAEKIGDNIDDIREILAQSKTIDVDKLKRLAKGGDSE